MKAAGADPVASSCLYGGTHSAVALNESRLRWRCPLRQVEAPQHFSEARFLPQAIEEWLGREDPVLYRSFGGASLELAQHLVVFAKASVDEGEIERIDVSALPSDLLEAAEDRAGILMGPCRAEDGARVAAPDRVPGSRGERPMHEADSLL